MLSSLRVPAFALLWTGRTISRLGDSIYLVAVAWWIVQNADAQARGEFLMAGVIPSLVLLLVGGLAVDRLPRLAVLLGSDVVHCAAVGLTGLLALVGRLELVELIVLAAVFGAASAFFYPAAQASVPELVTPDLRSSANSMNRISAEVTGIAGPPLGAAAVGLLGAGGALLIDAATFAVSAAAIVGIAMSRVSWRSGAVAGRGRSGLGEGWRIVSHTPWLWITIAVAGVSNITMAGPIEVALPFLVRTDLHGDASLYGILLGVSALGALVIAILLGRSPRLRHRGLMAYGGWLVSAGAVAAMGLQIGVVGTAFAMLGVGGGLAMLELAWVRSLQDIVPPEALGRVSSIDALGSSSLLPIGFAAAGVATAAYGAPSVFLIGGLISACLIVAGLLHPSIRGLD